MIEQILQDWPLWGMANAPIQAHEIKPLPQGLTNQGWLLTLDSGCFVLRIAAANSDELNINREAEYQIHTLLAQHQLAPPIRYRAPDNSYWIRDYVAGIALTPADLTLETLHAMAGYLQKIHALPVQALVAQAAIPEIDMQQKIQAYEQQLGAPSIHSPSITHHSSLCLCHMDPTPANWIRQKNGQLCLLDWEYAGLGNPLWDIAVLLQQAKLTAKQEQKLLQNWGLSNDQAWAQAKQQMAAITALWFELQG